MVPYVRIEKIVLLSPKAPGGLPAPENRKIGLKQLCTAFPLSLGPLGAKSPPLFCFLGEGKGADQGRGLYKFWSALPKAGVREVGIRKGPILEHLHPPRPLLSLFHLSLPAPPRRPHHALPSWAESSSLVLAAWSAKVFLLTGHTSPHAVASSFSWAVTKVTVTALS